LLLVGAFDFDSIYSKLFLLTDLLFHKARIGNP
jgi:hypothetical protein